MKVGRNDPCPCGSGKKHKHCCLGREERGSQSRAVGVALAIDWLGQRHRKALTRALDVGLNRARWTPRQWPNFGTNLATASPQRSPRQQGRLDLIAGVHRPRDRWSIAGKATG
jgi:SEC-C motif